LACPPFMVITAILILTPPLFFHSNWVKITVKTVIKIYHVSDK
jgi:hypothetical protein